MFQLHEGILGNLANQSYKRNGDGAFSKPNTKKDACHLKHCHENLEASTIVFVITDVISIDVSHIL
jgi:hypothetical protein